MLNRGGGFSSEICIEFLSITLTEDYVHVTQSSWHRRVQIACLRDSSSERGLRRQSGSAGGVASRRGFTLRHRHLRLHLHRSHWGYRGRAGPFPGMVTKVRTRCLGDSRARCHTVFFMGQCFCTAHNYTYVYWRKWILFNFFFTFGRSEMETYDVHNRIREKLLGNENAHEAECWKFEEWLSERWSWKGIFSCFSFDPCLFETGKINRSKPQGMTHFQIRSIHLVHLFMEGEAGISVLCCKCTSFLSFWYLLMWLL